MRYWLIKSEPDEFSIDDLAKEGSTLWTGVRNYQARNFMRDEMGVGDGILFYHSNAEPSGVAGLAKVASPAQLDPTAWEPRSEFFDPKAKPNDTVWRCVTVAFAKKFPRVLPLDELRAEPKLHDLLLLKRGMRLSVQPVSAEHFGLICRLV